MKLQQMNSLNLCPAKKPLHLLLLDYTIFTFLIPDRFPNEDSPKPCSSWGC